MVVMTLPYKVNLCRGEQRKGSKAEKSTAAEAFSYRSTDRRGAEGRNLELHGYCPVYDGCGYQTANGFRQLVHVQVDHTGQAILGLLNENTARMTCERAMSTAQ